MKRAAIQSLRALCLSAIAAFAAISAFGTGALAQGFPNKPIRIIIPYPAGGTTDLMARALQDPLQKSLGQPVLIENKADAGGIVAAREVARSTPDGHTLLFINSGIVAVKFWVAITKEEQLRRFNERKKIAFKQFKITEEDWRNRKKWGEYERAVCDMVERTSTPVAPWNVIPANHKRFAQIAILKSVCERLEASL